MNIDWFTVAAQVINFVILVLLLKRFLYRPILHAIDERENRIASDIADAREKSAAPTGKRMRS
jgi:F-type H+-transporting ATPase subunit b